MLELQDALRIVTDLASGRRVGTERVDLLDAFHRVIAEDIISDIDIPPFSKSTRDGFACRRVDLGNELKVVETIAAGGVPRNILGPNECARIMTGAAIPQGADCVVMLEHAEDLGANSVRCSPRRIGNNICPQGTNVTAGETVLHAGEMIKAQQVAVLASVGCSRPLVSRRPKVGVIATGSELVEPDRKPEAGQIRNSNSFQLSAMVLGASARPRNYGLVGDNKGAIQAVLRKAMAENDVVILSGGISKGDYDFVRGVLEENLVELVFDRVHVNPGRLIVFGISDGAFCFGLSGNPVSNFIMFELLVKPFLYMMAGHGFKATVSHAQMAETVARDEAEKDVWLPVSLGTDGRVHPIECRGSMSIISLCRADGLMHVPAGVTEVREGTTVVVRQI
jgi:molybdopterin molybdotransferase